MLYVLYGTDTAKSRSKLATLLSTLLSKKPDAMVLKSGVEDFSEATVNDYIESQGLFEQKSIVVLDTVFTDIKNKELVLEKLKDIQASENVFILLEGKLDAKSKTKLAKYSTKMQECELPKKQSKKSNFNIFELSDALGERNRKKLWVIYQEGKLHNVSPEEMHGILFWSVKNMLLASSSKDAKDSGLSSFVFQKANRSAKNYSDEDLKVLVKDLVDLYHQARRGKVPFDVGLERFLLELK